MHALQHSTTHYNTQKYSNALQRTAAHFNALHCNALQRTATHCNALQRTATHCNALQCTTTHCNTLQRSATHWNALQCITIKDCTLRVPNKRLSLVALLEAHMIVWRGTAEGHSMLKVEWRTVTWICDSPRGWIQRG